MSEYDDIAIITLEDDMTLLKRKAINASSFDTHLLMGTNHGYEGKEKEFAEEVLNWIFKRIINHES